MPKKRPAAASATEAAAEESLPSQATAALDACESQSANEPEAKKKKKKETGNGKGLKVDSPAYYKNNNSFGIKVDGKEKIRVP